MLWNFSFLGKLLVLPANVRLDWKGIARYKHSSLFGLVICNEEKKFNNIDTRFNGTVMLHPSEDSFSKIFSTTLGLAFKVKTYDDC
jgi:hypothetical protein